MKTIAEIDVVNEYRYFFQYGWRSVVDTKYVSNIVSTARVVGIKLKFRETAEIFKSLKCGRMSGVKSTFSTTFHSPLVSIIVVVRGFVVVITVVRFGRYGRSFVLFRSGCFVSLFRVSVHSNLKDVMLFG